MTTSKTGFFADFPNPFKNFLISKNFPFGNNGVSMTKVIIPPLTIDEVHTSNDLVSKNGMPEDASIVAKYFLEMKNLKPKMSPQDIENIPVNFIMLSLLVRNSIFKSAKYNSNIQANPPPDFLIKLTTIAQELSRKPTTPDELESALFVIGTAMQSLIGNNMLGGKRSGSSRPKAKPRSKSKA